jgi:hypothetical protein
MCDELTIIVQPQNVDMEELASYVSDFIHASWGVQTKIVFDSCDEKEGSLNIIVDEEAVSGMEEYDLLIAPHSITIKANHPTGAFWGFQSSDRGIKRIS